MNSMISVKVYPIMQEWLTQLGEGIDIEIVYPIFDLESEITMKVMETMNLDD